MSRAKNEKAKIAKVLAWAETGWGITEIEEKLLAEFGKPVPNIRTILYWLYTSGFILLKRPKLEPQVTIEAPNGLPELTKDQQHSVDKIMKGVMKTQEKLKASLVFNMVGKCSRCDGSGKIQIEEASTVEEKDEIKIISCPSCGGKGQVEILKVK